MQLKHIILITKSTTKPTIQRKLITINGMPFYCSTGNNSGFPDTWLPFYGINLTGGYHVLLAGGQVTRGWLIKPSEFLQKLTLSDEDCSAMADCFSTYPRFHKIFGSFPKDTIKHRFCTLACLLFSSELGGGIWDSEQGVQFKDYLRQKYRSFYDAVPVITLDDAPLSVDVREHNEEKYELINFWLSIDSSHTDREQITPKTADDLLYMLEEKKEDDLSHKLAATYLSDATEQDMWIAIPDSKAPEIQTAVVGGSGGEVGNGWKVHISIDPSKVATAAVLIAKLLSQEDMPRVSIKYAGKNLARVGQPGKQIAFHFYSKELHYKEKILKFLNQIEELLRKNSIGVDPRPINSDAESAQYKFDAPLPITTNNQRFHYRNDDYLVLEDSLYQDIAGVGNILIQGNQIFVQQSYYLSLEPNQKYNPDVNIPDPFIALEPQVVIPDLVEHVETALEQAPELNVPVSQVVDKAIRHPSPQNILACKHMGQKLKESSYSNQKIVGGLLLCLAGFLILAFTVALTHASIALSLGLLSPLSLSAGLGLASLGGALLYTGIGIAYSGIKDNQEEMDASAPSLVY